MEFFDTHVHLNSERFSPEDVEAMLLRAKEANVTKMAVIGFDLASSKLAVEQALANDGVYAVIGIHPHDAQEWDEATKEQLKALYASAKEKVLAIGEIGLDYHFDEREPDEVQAAAFRGQMDLAYELDLPFVIHARDADEDIWRLLQEQKDSGKMRALPGVMHCFSSDQEMADKVLELGFYLGFDGPVTYKNGTESLAIAVNCPIDRIVIETDCPYLAPVPKRGKTNEPSFLPYIAEKISEAREMDLEEFARISNENAMHLFALEEK